MKDTERINRINKDLNEHFKSNHHAWWVSNGFKEPGVIYLHRGIGGDKIDPRWIALRILRREPSVRAIHNVCGWDSWVYTRETLRWAGYKI